MRFLQETIIEIDPAARRVTTDAGVHEADVLVVALGADYDLDATPGLVEAGNEFYSVAGAARLARDPARLHERPRGDRRLRGALQVPAGAERVRAAAARLARRARRARRLRDHVRDPVRSPVPPSPDTSAALLDAFAERDIGFIPGRRIASLDAARKVAVSRTAPSCRTTCSSACPSTAPPRS